MAARDFQSDVVFSSGLDVGTIGSNTTVVGNIIDGQGAYEHTWDIFVQDYTDGTFTPLLEHGDAADLSDAVAIPDIDLLPAGEDQEAGAALSADGGAKLGYRGDKRYRRLSIVSTSVTTGATVGARSVLTMPNQAPTE